MRFSLIFLTLFALPIFGATLPRKDADGIPGYGVEDLSWEITLPDDSNVTLSGTIEQVAEQLDTLSPTWRAGLDNANAETLEKRTYFDPQDVRCGNFPYLRNPFRITNGIKYLRGLSGRPANGPGPGNCGRVSCANTGAIWWCNDTPERKELASFGSIADGAQVIVDRCTVRGIDVGVPPSPSVQVAGQAFHPTGWNVIVRKDSC
ncbi:hypothetical protein GT037_009831 [Alternaria burnsii]|uniref:Uncharacterized protein n=1 Tax=Alternaria burnsii TaxID=1187904 RepID=A0A8H7EDI7_9PLEO|nr:uncharacterized protein GT037_009831 [Alternaria burnsii]KAF7671932.1 hypothetical protein GT037_009831 [Alternaria burnsii]